MEHRGWFQRGYSVFHRNETVLLEMSNRMYINGFYEGAVQLPFLIFVLGFVLQNVDTQNPWFWDFWSCILLYIVSHLEERKKCILE